MSVSKLVCFPIYWDGSPEYLQKTTCTSIYQKKLTNFLTLDLSIVGFKPSVLSAVWSVNQQLRQLCHWSLFLFLSLFLDLWDSLSFSLKLRSRPLCKNTCTCVYSFHNKCQKISLSADSLEFKFYVLSQHRYFTWCCEKHFFSRSRSVDLCIISYYFQLSSQACFIRCIRLSWQDSKILSSVYILYVNCSYLFIYLFYMFQIFLIS